LFSQQDRLRTPSCCREDKTIHEDTKKREGREEDNDLNAELARHAEIDATQAAGNAGRRLLGFCVLRERLRALRDEAPSSLRALRALRSKSSFFLRLRTLVTLVVRMAR